MILRIASFIPAAWAVVMVFFLHHINKDPHQDDYGYFGGLLTKLTVGIAILNLLIAVPIRGVRLAATLLLSAFMVILFYEFAAWWLPGLLVAIIVTVADWTRKRDVKESEDTPPKKEWWVR